MRAILYDLLSLGEYAAKKALERKADIVEIYLQQGSYITVSIEREEISSASSGFETGIGIRVITEKALGFASSNRLDDSSIIEAIDAAIALAQKSPPEEFNSIPPEVPSGSGKIPGLLDRGIENFTVEKALEHSITILDDVTEEKKAYCESGGFSASVGQRAIVSSTGTAKEEVGNNFSWSLFGFAKDNSFQGPYCYEYGMCIKENDINVLKTSQDFKEQALGDLGRVKLGSDDVTFLLNNELLNTLVSGPILFCSSADSIYRNYSRFKGKLGEPVASELLTILDDGTIPENISSSNFDREGWTPERRIIIRDGIFTNVLTDYKSAQQLSVDPSGNAAGSYRSLPSISSYNLIYDCSKGNSRSQIIEDIKNGFLIKNFSGEPDLISGNFSLAVRGRVIEDGEIKQGTVREIIISGNIFELMNNVVAVSKEKKVVPGSETPELVIVSGISRVSK
ncbi:MAG: TldD/PmbA family protein [Candidatus Odinarchaeota archaeon]